jgi:hypothetical protein
MPSAADIGLMATHSGSDPKRSGVTDPRSAQSGIASSEKLALQCEPGLSSRWRFSQGRPPKSRARSPSRKKRPAQPAFSQKAPRPGRRNLCPRPDINELSGKSFMPRKAEATPDMWLTHSALATSPYDAATAPRKKGKPRTDRSKSSVGFSAMGELRRRWQQFGRVPALILVGSFFAVGIVAALLFEESAATAIGIGLFAVLILYCVARPRGGLDVFLIAAFPGAAATLLHDIAGTPRWIGALLIPISLLVIWADDREARGAEQKPQLSRGG